MDSLKKINDFFKPYRAECLKDGLLNPVVLATDTDALLYQVPGGMLSNLISQLKEQGKEDKLEEVLNEVPRVRADAGYPPLVTPSSQIVGTQAVLNVLAGERYKMVTKEFKGMIKGEYGQAPVQVSDEIKKMIIGDDKPITCRPADLLKPELETLRSEIAEYYEQDEDVLSYALLPQVAKKFFEFRRAGKYKIDPELVNMNDKTHPV